MKHGLNKLFLIRPYCDKSGQELIDYLVVMHEDFVKTARVIAEIKDNLRSNRRLNRKLKGKSTQLDMISRRFAGQINAEFNSQDKRLKSAGRVLSRYFLSLFFKNYVNSFKMEIDMLKRKYRNK